MRKRERYRAATGQDKRGDRHEMHPPLPVFKEITGGIGGRHARGDLRLIRHAIREDWPLDDAKCAALMEHVTKAVDTSGIAGTPARIFFAAALCAIEADKANHRFEKAQRSNSRG